MMDIKVSVVVPAYNVEGYIEKCVNSLFEQTLKEFEVVCINDGSTDRTKEILERLAENDPRVVVIHQENRGLSAVRNRGIEQARGEYILFLDSDDWLERDALLSLYTMAGKDHLDVVFFAARAVFETEELKRFRPGYEKAYSRSDSEGNILTGREMLKRQVQFGEYSPSACLYMMRRDFLDRFHLRFEEGILHEDNLFTFAILLYSERTESTASRFYQRLYRDGSIMTAQPTWRNLQGYIRVVRREMEMLSGTELSDEEAEGFNILCESLVYDCILTWNKLSEQEKKKAYKQIEDEDAVFLKTVVAPLGRRISNYVSKEKEMQREIAKKEDEMEVLRSSRSYRLANSLSKLLHR